jgi:hypothetical protein
VMKVMRVLRKGGDKAYQKGIKAMTCEDRENWEEWLADEEYQATSDDLYKFIDTHIFPEAVVMMKEAKHHFAIKNQALGEGLRPAELESLCRYETHLDRKFQRILGMLIKLKELRGGN